jgi:hypothetical protein
MSFRTVGFKPTAYDQFRHPGSGASLNAAGAQAEHERNLSVSVR